MVAAGGGQVDQGDLLLWGKVASNIEGKESSVPVVSVQGLEHHHPTVSMIWGHRDRVRIKERKKLDQRDILQVSFHELQMNILNKYSTGSSMACGEK